MDDRPSVLAQSKFEVRAWPGGNTSLPPVLTVTYGWTRLTRLSHRDLDDGGYAQVWQTERWIDRSMEGEPDTRRTHETVRSGSGDLLQERLVEA